MDQGGRPVEMQAVQRLYETQRMELRGFVELCKTFEENQIERNATWRQEAEDLARSLESKRCELARCELELGNIRGKLLKCENAKWIPEEDQSIQHAVQDLQSTIRSWAKDYSVKSFKNVFGAANPPPQKALILRRLSLFTGYRDAQELERLEHPFLLLAGLLSLNISINMFADPFFHLRDPGVGQPSSFAERLNKMFQEMKDVDERKANSWRKDIIRHEFPDSASPLTKDSQAGELLVPNSVDQEALNHAYNALQAKFSKAMFPGMLEAKEGEEAQKMKGDLHQIFKRAGNLHFRLLTQQASFVWTPTAKQVGKRFNVHDDGLWIDQLHHLADRTDESLNDHVVQIVVGTGLAACGDAFGGDYSKHRVIAPARVYLEKDARAAVETFSPTHQGPCSPGLSSRRSSIRLASGRKESVPAPGTADASSLPQGNQNVADSEQPAADAGVRKSQRRKCEACAKARAKCDYKIPICSRCAQTDRECHWHNIAATKRARAQLESVMAASEEQSGSTDEPGGQNKTKRRKETEDEGEWTD